MVKSVMCMNLYSVMSYVLGSEVVKPVRSENLIELTNKQEIVGSNTHKTYEYS